jgi:hypothetical protein
MAKPAGINVSTASASDLQDPLTAGKVRSIGLVDLYLRQIETYNTKGLMLRAVIHINSTLG